MESCIILLHLPQISSWHDRKKEEIRDMQGVRTCLQGKVIHAKD